MAAPSAAATAARQGTTTRRSAVTEEERRRNRMTSNRLSARKSRMKRQQREDELTATLDRLARENEALRASVDGALRHCRQVEQENRVLAAHERELCAMLALRNSQLRHLAQLYGGDDMLQMQMPPASSPPPLLPMEIYQTLFWDESPDFMDATDVCMLGF